MSEENGLGRCGLADAGGGGGGTGRVPVVPARAMDPPTAAPGRGDLGRAGGGGAYGRGDSTRRPARRGLQVAGASTAYSGGRETERQEDHEGREGSGQQWREVLRDRRAHRNNAAGDAECQQANRGSHGYNPPAPQLRNCGASPGHPRPGRGKVLSSLREVLATEQGRSRP